MVRTLPPIDDHVAGDTLRKKFIVRDDAGNALDIRNARVEWAVIDFLKDDVYLDESDDDVDSEITDGLAGEVEVKLGSDDGNDGATADLDGPYRQRLRLWDGQGNRNTYLGEFHVIGAGKD
jgi:hypothetical protein